MPPVNPQFDQQDFASLLCSPQVLVELFEACLEGSDPQALAEIVLQDTALSARLIQIACRTCAAQLDPAEPVSSAISALGLPVLCSLALQAAKQLIGHDFSATELVFLHRLWFLARVAGQAAYCIAPSVGYSQVEEARLAGALLTLGNHLLFARHRQSYVDKAGDPLSSSGLRRREDEAYATDHMRLAEEAISDWRFDSFLVDAVRFLHVDAEQIEKSNPLLKVTRLAFQFCREPEQLTADSKALAQRLFGFRDSEMEYLFDWAQSLYQPCLPALATADELRENLNGVLTRLTELMFVLADQEGVRARLACSTTPEELATAARRLYLESCTTPEVIFLSVDQRCKELVGIVADGQAPLLGELMVSLEARASLPSQALLKGTALDSLQVQRPLAVMDQMLLRLVQSCEIFCQPFQCDGRLLGVAVIGFDAPQELEKLQSLRLKMLARMISESFTQLNLAGGDRFGDSSSLLRRASHEISNPLTIIGNYTEVLNQVLVDSENQELVDAIKKEVRRIDDIFNYYLNQQELPNFPGSGVCLNQLIRDTLDSLTPGELEPRRIAVELKLQEDLSTVSTSAVLVKQILVNLVKNAAEAIGEGGLIVLQTRDSYGSDGTCYAELVIEDDGPGIDPLVQKKLFQPIVSTKGPGHAGVGLSIVKGMVDDLAGQITYYDVPGAGAGFNLRIPSGDLRAEDIN